MMLNHLTSCAGPLLLQGGEIGLVVELEDRIFFGAQVLATLILISLFEGGETSVFQFKFWTWNLACSTKVSPPGRRGVSAIGGWGG